MFLNVFFQPPINNLLIFIQFLSVTDIVHYLLVVCHQLYIVVMSESKLLFLLFLQTNMLLVKANDTKSCFHPLVQTKNEISWYPYVDGCGLQCENVLFTEADHAHAHIFIAIAGLLSSSAHCLPW